MNLKSIMQSLLLSLVFCLIGFSTAGAVSVAVFPIEDLSQGRNGMHQELTGYLADKLAAKGLSVVPAEAVLSFMTNQRVRYLGYLETKDIQQAGIDLAVDYILMGTICQYQKNPATLGITVSLVRTGDAKNIWSNSGGVSVNDEHTLLGMETPKAVNDLYPIIADQILTIWPKDLTADAEKNTVTNLNSLPENKKIEIESVLLTPQYVRPGEKVKCVVKLQTKGAVRELPQVFFKVGSQVHLAAQSAEGLFFEASWTGSGVEGNRVQLAAESLEPVFFEEVWQGSNQAASYPVEMIFTWPSGEQKIAYLGKYEVDSQPPSVALELKGIELQDIITFRDELPIYPRWIEREPISRWQISVTDKDGKPVLSDEGKDKLPNRFLWKGQTSNHAKVQAGIYTVSLKVWDRAGNEAATTETVAYRPDPPNIDVVVEAQDEQLVVEILHEDKIPLTYWRVELWSGDNTLLKQQEGTDQPAQVKVTLPENIGNKENIACIIVSKDILGNRMKKEIKNLLQLASHANAGAEEQPTPASETWIEEF